ncbi:MAG: 3-methyl-2-oxobutanoate hydroxymethyltransferase, partial [Pseudomonadota bacterium]
QYVNADEARRAAFNAMEKGADAIYCPMALDVVESLAREAIPVHGHVGFVPYKNSWTGGFRAVGKTAEDAFAILERARDYERAGAIAIEVELVPKEVAELISREVGILTVGMGAGAGCDAQYLFAKDILGYNDGHIPRHAKVYRDHRSEYQRLYEDSVAAFGEFREEVESGGFPAAGNLLTMDPAELDALRRKVEP